MKIVSLVPSITESLIDLGAAEVIGRTKFCIHPKEKVDQIAIIGGTKNINIDKILALKPDLIIANKEENVKDQVEELMQHHKVMVTNVETIEDNYYLIKSLGNLLGQQHLTQQYYLKIYENLNQGSLTQPIKAAYLIWKKPYMTIGGDTFIHQILQQLGFSNLFGDSKRYPTIEVEDLKDADVIMLSSEPFPFKEQHIAELKEIYPEKKIMIVDGEAFSWYGTHLAKCGSYYKSLLAEFQ